jgi:hypothetical protein
MIAPATWTEAQQGLWHRIQAHRFERPDQALDLLHRLAREKAWPLPFARAAIEEYRRFCFLCVAGPPARDAAHGPDAMTPSEEVDEVWHLHLIHSRDYWDLWCGQALGRRLHHDPTAGGPVEARRYRAQYAATLARYEAFFGPPPESHWPGTRQRFRAQPRFRSVDTDRSFIIPRIWSRRT